MINKMIITVMRKDKKCELSRCSLIKEKIACTDARYLENRGKLLLAFFNACNSRGVEI